MEEVRISDWPEPPGSHAWLPAYGFQHDLMDKDAEYFGTNGECRSCCLFCAESLERGVINVQFLVWYCCGFVDLECGAKPGYAIICLLPR